MTLMVTGCLGFIGSNLVQRLLNDGHVVIGVDNRCNLSLNPHQRIRSGAGKNISRFHLYNTDINDEIGMRVLGARYSLDAIIHLAAIGSVPRSFADPVSTLRANVLGFAAIAELASSFNIPRVIYASSSSVYGDHPEYIRVEGREGLPLSPYALSKKTNEDMARIWSSKSWISFVGLRFFNVYGPGQKFDSDYSAVIPKFINSEAPVINGDGQTMRDFTYVDDVCDAIITSLAVKAASEVFNIGTGKGTTLTELLFRLDKGGYVTGPERSGDIKKSVADISKARDVLGFVAKTHIKEGLEKTVAFYRGEKPKNGPEVML